MSLKKQPLIDKNMIIPFWLLTSCFIVWGLAQDLTAPLVTAFKGIFTMSTFEASLVQFAYFGAYFCLALPTAFLNERFATRSASSPASVSPRLGHSGSTPRPSR